MKPIFIFCLACSCAAAWAQTTQPQRVSISRTANEIILQWQADPGRTYQVESATAITGPWQTRASVAATAALGNWVNQDLIAGNQRFYRIAYTVETNNAPAREALFAGDFIPKNAAFMSQQGSELGAQAVFLASQLQGGQQLITTGTLTQQGQFWNYAPTPSDRLQVQFQAGTNLTYYITRMQGDFSRDAVNFLQQSHVFYYRVVTPGIADFTVTSEIPPGTCTVKATLRGSLISSNVTYNLDLAANGQYCLDSSFGYTLLDDRTLTGTVTAPDLNLTVNQRRRYEFIAGNNDSASSEEDWNNNTLKIGADTYQWVNAKRQKSFKNGKASSLDTYWGASGGVLKNGAPYGLYQMRAYSELGTVKFLLVLPDEVIELESWIVLL